MIKSLKSNIFLLIMISLSAVVLGIIIIFTVLNYRNTINASTSMLDRFVDKVDTRKDFEEKIEEEPENEVEGLYYILVENSKVINASDISEDETIENIAIELSNGHSETGIKGNYVYKINQIRENSSIVILMENESVVWYIRLMFICVVVVCCISLIIIYIIAKKASEMLVKPVEDTLEKQTQFISDASHELKTPLAVIEANSDVLENEIGENKWLSYIQNEIDSMNKLVNELLLLAKMENVETLKNYEKFNVSEEIEVIIAMFESMAYEKGVKIDTNIQEDIVMDGCKEDIEHILSTLVDNAIKHTETENNIVIEAKKEKNNIVIKVKNVGEKIPEEERDKLFERFYRLDKARNRNEKRYGLGLAIAKSTVEKYNGKIEISYEEKYNVFKVTIPV